MKSLIVYSSKSGNTKKLASSCRILGSFNCQGEVNKDIIVKAQAKDPQPPWIKDAPAATGHPNSEDIDNLLKTLEKVID